MPTIGEVFVREALKSKKRSDASHNRMVAAVAGLNRRTHDAAAGLYHSLIDHMQEHDSIIRANETNFLLLSGFMPMLDRMMAGYRSEYSKTFNKFRGEMFELVREKEERLMRVVSKMGVSDDRVTPTQQTLDMLNTMNQQGYVRIENIIAKWRAFVYDSFFVSISQGFTKKQLRESLYTSTGNLRIGSSLEEASEIAASISAVEQRTAYLRAQAEKNGYTYCWNVNPMDRRTKSECIMASLAGVIPEKQMATDHGFPPRYVCRCEVAYTRKEWTELNSAINTNIADVRLRLIQALLNAPRQMGSWFVGGTRVVSSDVARASGAKMYADVEKKLRMVQDTQVPPFRGGPKGPSGVVPPTSPIPPPVSQGGSGADMLKNPLFQDLQNMDLEQLSKHPLWGDINAGLHSGSGGSADAIIEEFARMRGYNGAPTLLNNKDFVAADGLQLKRGLTDPKFVEQFKTGEYFGGKGVYGNGTYTAYGSTMDQTSKSYAGLSSLYDGPHTEADRIINMKLKPGLKIVDEGDLRQIRRDFVMEASGENKSNAFFDKISAMPKGPERDLLAAEYKKMSSDSSKLYVKLDTAFADKGRFATFMGYDAINIPDREFMIILNRTAVVVER